jgi:hypothetical protein
VKALQQIIRPITNAFYLRMTRHHFRPMLQEASKHDGPALVEARVHRLDGSGS